jgi:hypothetical protein
MSLFVILIMIVITFGTAESKHATQTPQACVPGNYDLSISIKGRFLFSHIYHEGATALFKLTIWNRGPDASPSCNITFTIKKLIGQGSGEMQQQKIIYYGSSPGSGNFYTITHFVSNYERIGFYKVQAAIDANDSNTSNNIATFYFFTVEC